MHCNVRNMLHCVYIPTHCQRAHMHVCTCSAAVSASIPYISLVPRLSVFISADGLGARLTIMRACQTYEPLNIFYVLTCTYTHHTLCIKNSYHQSYNTHY